MFTLLARLGQCSEWIEKLICEKSFFRVNLLVNVVVSASISYNYISTQLKLLMLCTKVTNLSKIKLCNDHKTQFPKMRGNNFLMHLLLF